MKLESANIINFRSIENVDLNDFGGFKGWCQGVVPDLRYLRNYPTQQFHYGVDVQRSGGPADCTVGLPGLQPNKVRQPTEPYVLMPALRNLPNLAMRNN